MNERNHNLRNPNPNVVSLTHGFNFLKGGQTDVSRKDLSLPVPTVRRDPPRNEPLSQKPKTIQVIVAPPPKIISPRPTTIPQRSSLLARNRIADMRDTEVGVSETGVDALMGLIDSGSKKQTTSKPVTFPKPIPEKVFEKLVGTFDESLVTSAAIAMVETTKKVTSEIPREKINAMVSVSLKKAFTQYNMSLKMEISLYLREKQTQKKLNKKKPVSK